MNAYGAARVLVAGEDVPALALARGTEWLAAAQGEEGGWGGAPGVATSIEETALALEALADRAASCCP